ncbi:hypothetical protein MLD38_040706 [Melastoma candidum]|nr:hypothetical protein MLD38_040706 [Melastoma candidum]
MGRRKVKLELINNESVRKTTFRKRKGGLFKKVGELKTLCGIDACSIVYGTNDDEPYCWPDPDEAARVVGRLHSLPSHKQGKHMLSHEQYVEKNLGDLEAKLERGSKRNQGMEMELRLKELLSPSKGEEFLEEMDKSELKELLDILDGKLDEIVIKMDSSGDSSGDDSDDDDEDSD